LEGIDTESLEHAALVKELYIEPLQVGYIYLSSASGLSNIAKSVSTATSASSRSWLRKRLIWTSYSITSKFCTFRNFLSKSLMLLQNSDMSFGQNTMNHYKSWLANSPSMLQRWMTNTETSAEICHWNSTRSCI
jgi:hypothetical protein